MRVVVWVAALALVTVLVAMAWQHRRYVAARRGPVQDRQPLVYGRSAFHVVTFLRAHPDGDVLEALRKLRSDVEGAGARTVYAGVAAPVGLASSQLGDARWDAVVLVQHPSRERYEALAVSEAYRRALDRFAAAYSHGMDRSVLLNLGIPMLLLALRARQIALRLPSHYPLVPDPERAPNAPAGEQDIAKLDPLRPYGEDAVVIVNLLKHGDAEQRAADRAYGLAMAGAFAEGAHGPMHMGRAVAVEGEARFDRVALVYYPGIDYMQALMRSRFFNSIVGGKQPGDTLAVPTVPVLSRL